MLGSVDGEERHMTGLGTAWLRPSPEDHQYLGSNPTPSCSLLPLVPGPFLSPDVGLGKEVPSFAVHLPPQKRSTHHVCICLHVCCTICMQVPTESRSIGYP